MPVQDAILSYLRQNRGTFSDAALTLQLRKSGWSDADIRDSFAAIGPAGTPASSMTSSQTSEAMPARRVTTKTTVTNEMPATTVVSTTTTVVSGSRPGWLSYISRPHTAFMQLSMASPNPGWWDALKAPVLFELIIAVLLIIAVVAFGTAIAGFVPAVAPFVGAVGIAMVVEAIALPILVAISIIVTGAIFWGIGRLLKGTGTYLRVTEHISYAYVASQLLGILTLLVVIAAALVSLQGSTLSLVATGVAGIVALAIMLYSIHIYVRAISSAHDVSYKRALVIVLIPVILIGIFVGAAVAMNLATLGTFHA